jgi:hypothetical protein
MAGRPIQRYSPGCIPKKRGGFPKAAYLNQKSSIAATVPVAMSLSFSGEPYSNKAIRYAILSVGKTFYGRGNS